MVERVIFALIYICGIALCYFLIIWVLGAIGLHLPGTVVNILLVVLVLVAILVLWRLFAGSGIRLWPGP
jgi:putative effector of murein hydrolase LrgA (UPF0299 family)